MRILAGFPVPLSQKSLLGQVSFHTAEFQSDTPQVHPLQTPEFGRQETLIVFTRASQDAKGAVTTCVTPSPLY